MPIGVPVLSSKQGGYAPYFNCTQPQVAVPVSGGDFAIQATVTVQDGNNFFAIDYATTDLIDVTDDTWITSIAFLKGFQKQGPTIFVRFGEQHATPSKNVPFAIYSFGLGDGFLGFPQQPIYFSYTLPLINTPGQFTTIASRRYPIPLTADCDQIQVSMKGSITNTGWVALGVATLSL